MSDNIINNNILGRYDFDNFTKISPFVNEKDILGTSIHEYIHMILSLQSNVGVTSYCLSKLNIQKENTSDFLKMKVLSDFLIDISKKVQEGIAMYFEAISWICESNDCYKKNVDELRLFNNEYYKYIKPLLPVLYLLKNDKDKIRDVSLLVYKNGIAALDIEIFNIDTNVFNSANNIQKFKSNKDNSIKYNPNKKFLEICSVISKFDSIDKIINYLNDSCDNLDIDDYVKKRKQNLDKIKEFILKLFSDSKVYSEYNKTLSDIEIREKEFDNIFYNQLPTTNFDNIYGLENLNYDELKKMDCNINHYLLFLFGSMDKYLSELKGIVSNNILGLDKIEFSILYQMPNKKYALSLSNTQMRELIISNPNIILLVSYKYFDFYSIHIVNHMNINKKTYIYCDRTYNGALEFINTFENHQCYYRYMQYKNMFVLLISIDGKAVFVLPMTTLAGNYADFDIRNNKKFLHRACDNDNYEGYDKYIITDEKTRDEIDIIINSLFFIN